MIESFRNIFAIPDLRKRLVFTFLMLAVYRVGWCIPLPMFNQDTEASSSGGGVWPARRPPTSYFAHQSRYWSEVSRHLRDRAGSPWRARMMAPGRTETRAGRAGWAVAGIVGSAINESRAGAGMICGG